MADLEWQDKWHKYFVESQPSLEGLDGLKSAGSTSVKFILDYYRKSNRQNLRAVLNDKFEVTLKLLENSDLLREKYIEQEPSEFASIDNYGFSFLEFLKKNGSSEAIIELARLEDYLYSFGFHIPKNNEELSWETLTAETEITLQNARVYKSQYNVFQMWNDEVLIVDPCESQGVVYFLGFQASALSLENWEVELIEILTAGCNLTELNTESLAEIAPEKVQNFFTFLRQDNLVTTV